MSGTNTYTGGTTVSAGTLAIGNYQALGSGGVSLAAGTTLALAANIAPANPVANAITLAGNATIDNGGYTGYFSNPITGAFALTVAGSGTTVIAGANTPASTTIAAGTLALNTGATLANSITINNGATYDLSRGAANPVLSSVTAASGSNIRLGDHTLSLASGTINGNLLDGGLSTLTGAIVKKTGVGTLTLAGTNTYSGGTDLEAGVVVASNAAALGTGTATIGTASSAGTLRMGGAYTIANAVALSTAQTSTIDLNGNNTTFSGIFSGGGNTFALTNSGGATRIATFTGANTHTGTTSLGAFVTAALSGSGTLGSSTVSFTDATSILDVSAVTTSVTIGDLNGTQGQVALGAKNLAIGTTATTATFAGVIFGVGGSVTKRNTGTATLSGTNTHTGGTTIEAGILIAGDAAALGTGTATIGTASSAGTLRMGGAYTIANAVALSTAQTSTIDLNGNNTTFSGVFSGGGATLAFANSGGAARIATLTGANTHLGTTSIGALTTVALSGAGTLGSSNASFAAATSILDISAITPASLSIGDLSGTQGQVALGAKNLTIGTTATTANFAGVISGVGGSLTKSNTGTATLSGVNTYTGGTTVSAGTLAISNYQALGSGGVSLAAGTALALAANIAPVNPVANAITLVGNATINNGGYTGYLSNPITGAFALTSSGSGTLVIAGANTPASTTISSGTLALNTGATLANNITINNGATYDLSQGPVNPSLDNITANPGSNIRLGDQTATITSGTISGNILDGGISGQTGAIVEKTGGGTATLSGTNTYSGGTNLHAGVLTINGTQSLGTGPVEFATAGATLRVGSSLGSAIPNNIVLTADGILDTQVYNVTLGGSISGGATLRKLGSGILTLSGANTYNGAVLQDGIIALGNNQGFGVGTFSFDMAGTVLRIAAPLSNVANPVTLVADGTIDTQGNDANFTGSFSGVGGLTKNGLGVLRLSNINNTYSGPTVVNGGELKVPNGTLINSPVTVENGARFTGNATVLRLTNRGITKPGNSIGIIQVLTNFDNTGGTYNCEINDAGQSDLIQVTNTATLGGTLHILPQAGDYSTIKTYTILTAGNPITTQFNTVTSSSALLKYTLTYLANSVRLAAEQAFTLVDIITEGNAKPVADYISGLNPAPGSPLGNLINILPTLSLPELYEVINQLHPAANKMVASQLINHEFMQLDTVLSSLFMDRNIKQMRKRLKKSAGQAEQLSYAFTKSMTPLTPIQGQAFSQKEPPSIFPKFYAVPSDMRTSIGRTTLWLKQSGSQINQQSIGDGSPTIGTPGVKARVAGTSMGGDTEFSEKLVLGASLGYSRTSYTLRRRYGNGTISSYRAGLYGRWTPYDDWYVSAAGFYGYHRFKGNRNLIIGTNTYTNRQEHQGMHVSGALEIGRDIAITPVTTIMPYGGVGELYLREKGYTESAQGLNPGLQVKGQTNRIRQAKVGVQLSHLTPLQTIDLYVYGKLGYVNFSPVKRRRGINASFSGYDGGFSVYVKDKSKNMVDTNLALIALINEHLSLSLSYGAQISAREHLHQGIFRIDYKF